MVREGGLEPPRDCSHKVLSLARLPFRHSRSDRPMRLAVDGNLFKTVCLQSVGIPQKPAFVCYALCAALETLTESFALWRSPPTTRSEPYPAHAEH